MGYFKKSMTVGIITNIIFYGEILSNIEDFYLNIFVFKIINHNRNPVFDIFFQYFYLFGKGWILIPIGILLFKFKRQKFWQLAIAVSFETFFVYLMKFIFKVPRPASMLKDVYLVERLYYGSFPSGDTALAFVVAICLSYGSPSYIKILLFLYAFLIAYGRIYLGVHFPLDVVVGAFIGIFSGILAYLVLKIFAKGNKKWQNS